MFMKRPLSSGDELSERPPVGRANTIRLGPTPARRNWTDLHRQDPGSRVLLLGVMVVRGVLNRVPSATNRMARKLP